MDVEHVVDLDLGFRPEAAISGALLLRSETLAILTFNAMRRTAVDRLEDAGTAVIEFARCLLTKFGLPNDEALPGHPLFRHGLEAYGCFEVLNSRWRKEAEDQNRVQFPDTDYSSVRHFIFTFHDSSFECLANDLSVRLVPLGEFRAEYDSLVDRLYNG
jgi:hypothetical protein